MSISYYPHEPTGTSAEAIALTFAEALLSREYQQAYSLTSAEFQSQNACEEMQQSFESIFPIGENLVMPPQIILVMDDWANKLPIDLQWVYVAFGGEGYGEAIAVVVANEQDLPKIRTVEWGRP